MGDARHKKPPPKAVARLVTDVFVKQVDVKLRENDLFNTQHNLRKGEVGYRIASHADLASAIDADPNTIKNMFGGVRPGTKTKPVGKSKFVDPICDVLGIDRLERIEVEVPTRLAMLIRRLTSASEEELTKIEKKLVEK